MKKLYLLFITLSCSLIAPALYAQANVDSMGFAYSVLIRDNTGAIQANKQQTLRFTLFLGMSANLSDAAWVETQTTQTDSYGFANVTLGAGTQTGGKVTGFNNLDFAGNNYWLLAEALNNTTNTYIPLEKKPLQAVPYAKYAGSVVTFAPGTIIAYSAGSTPAGWLPCDGRELDNSNPLYLPLFKAIGYNWGTSNNTNKFNIPNTQGMFLRGASNGTGRDPDAGSRIPFIGGSAGDNIGSKQLDAFQAHEHFFNGAAAKSMPTDSTLGVRLDPSATTDHKDYRTFFFGDATDTKLKIIRLVNGKAATNGEYGRETRPENVYVNYIIKI